MNEIGNNFKKLLIMTALLATSTIAPAIAQSQTKVADILGSAIDEMSVILRGKIIEATEGEGKYIFQDETGQITVNIADDDFTHDPNSPVEILGEINLVPEESTVEIDVNKIKQMSPEENLENSTPIQDQ